MGWLLRLGADAEEYWLRLFWGSAGIVCAARGFANSRETARRAQLAWCQAPTYQFC